MCEPHSIFEIKQLYLNVEWDNDMSVFYTNKKKERSISWNEGIDPEMEDRLAYLELSSKEKWNYLMALILASYPPDKEVTFKKRTIEWT